MPSSSNANCEPQGVLLVHLTFWLGIEAPTVLSSGSYTIGQPTIKDVTKDRDEMHIARYQDWMQNLGLLSAPQPHKPPHGHYLNASLSPILRYLFFPGKADCTDMTEACLTTWHGDWPLSVT